MDLLSKVVKSNNFYKELGPIILSSDINQISRLQYFLLPVSHHYPTFQEIAVAINSFYRTAQLRAGIACHIAVGNKAVNGLVYSALGCLYPYLEACASVWHGKPPSSQNQLEFGKDAMLAVRLAFWLQGEVMELMVLAVCHTI